MLFLYTTFEKYSKVSYMYKAYLEAASPYASEYASTNKSYLTLFSYV